MINAGAKQNGFMKETMQGIRGTGKLDTRETRKKELIMWWQFGKPRLIPPEIEGRKAGEKLARKLKKLIWKDCTEYKEE